jgi:hypothetical protein
MGRSSGFRIGLLAAPSRLALTRQWLLAAFVPGYSGGTATDLHRFPYSSLQTPSRERHPRRGSSYRARNACQLTIDCRGAWIRDDFATLSRLLQVGEGRMRALVFILCRTVSISDHNQRCPHPNPLPSEREREEERAARRKRSLMARPSPDSETGRATIRSRPRASSRRMAAKS